MYRKSFAEQHPILLGVGIILGACTVAALWQLFLILAIVGLGYGAYRLANAWNKGRQSGQQRRAQLTARADYEHRLWMGGDPRGFYGRYPPAV
jgi:flagellar motor component MotA